MSPKTTILALVGLNVVLAGALTLVHTRRPGPAPEPVVTVNKPPKDSPRIEEAPAVPISPPSSKLSWSNLVSSDLRQFIANLRAVGCPPATIEDLVVADVNRQFAAREVELRLLPQHYSPWEPDGLDEWGLLRRQRQARALAREKRALLRELLGIDRPLELPAALADPKADRAEAALAALPEAKRERVREIEEAFWDKDAAWRERTRGFADPDDLAERRRLAEERAAALAQVLDAKEADTYEVATSDAAVAMRGHLAAFEPTEAEFRDLFRIQRDFDRKFDATAGSDEATGEKNWQAVQGLEVELKAVLGEARYAEYKRAQDASFRNLWQVTRDFGVSREAAIQAYEKQQTIRRESARLRADRSLSAEQRRAALNALKQDLRDSLRQVLGEDASRAYQESGGSGAAHRSGVTP